MASKYDHAALGGFVKEIDLPSGARIHRCSKGDIFIGKDGQIIDAVIHGPLSMEDIADLTGSERAQQVDIIRRRMAAMIKAENLAEKVTHL